MIQPSASVPSIDLMPSINGQLLNPEFGSVPSDRVELHVYDISESDVDFKEFYAKIGVTPLLYLCIYVSTEYINTLRCTVCRVL